MGPVTTAVFDDTCGNLIQIAQSGLIVAQAAPVLRREPAIDAPEAERDVEAQQQVAGEWAELVAGDGPSRISPMKIASHTITLQGMRHMRFFRGLSGSGRPSGGSQRGSDTKPTNGMTGGY